MAEMWVVSVRLSYLHSTNPTGCDVMSCYISLRNSTQTPSTTPSVTSATKNMVLYYLYLLWRINIWTRLIKVILCFFDLQANFVKMIIIRYILQISHQTSHYWQELTDFNGKTVLLWEFEKLSRAQTVVISLKCSCQIWFTLNRHIINHYPVNIYEISQYFWRWK